MSQSLARPFSDLPCESCGSLVSGVHSPEWGPVARPGMDCPCDGTGCGSHTVAMAPTESEYIATTVAMGDALAARGWAARTESLSGGLWGVVVNPGDGPRLLVSMDPDTPYAAPWIIGVDCQSHPDHGTAEGTLFEPWSDWGSLVPRISLSLHALRTLPYCPCDDCAYDARSDVCCACGGVFPLSDLTDVNAARSNAPRPEFVCPACL